MGSRKRHNLNLNKLDFSCSATDKCAFSPWTLSWTFYSECVSRPAACHMPLKTPVPLHAVRSGWAARLTWKKGSSHKTAAPGPSHHHCPAQRLQHQSKMISQKRLFLVKLLGTLPMEKRGKEQAQSGSNSLVFTKLNCPLFGNMGQYQEPCPRWLFVVLCSPPPSIYSGAKSELLSNILDFYFCYSLSCPHKKRVITQWRLLLTYARHLKI